MLHDNTTGWLKQCWGNGLGYPTEVPEQTSLGLRTKNQKCNEGRGSAHHFWCGGLCDDDEPWQNKYK
jgi:hypothetical protein